jgi:hypothetical protein
MVFMADAMVVVAGALAPTAAAPIAGPAGDPPAILAPVFNVGDTWVYDRSNERGTSGFTQRRVDLTIDRVDTDTMLVGYKPDGAPIAFEDHRTGLDWSQRHLVDGVETVLGRPFAFPMKVGDTWTADYVEPKPQGRQTFAHFHQNYKVVGWETVTVPAGVFRALKVQEDGVAEARITTPASASSAAVATPSGGATVAVAQRAQSGLVHVITYAAFYYVPSIKYYVKSVEEEYDSDDVRITRDTDVLVSFRPGP